MGEFGLRLCINLDRRPDRWERFSAMAEREGMDVQRLRAVDHRETRPVASWHHPAGAYASLCSHIKALSMGLSELQNVLIFEDDCEVVPGFERRAEELVKSLPRDWDMIYFGGNHHADPIPVSEGLGRCRNTRSIHCYGVRVSSIPKLLSALRHRKEWADVEFARHHASWNCYVATPGLAWQVEDYSDIDERPSPAHCKDGAAKA